jgi:hypothetical protein
MQVVKSVLIFIAVAAMYSVRSQDIHSMQLPAISVDGKPDEWPQPFRYYEGTTKLQFAFANDTGSLYVCIKVTDAQTQLRLFNSGLNICMDARGKKKETMVLSFPLKPEGDPGEGGSGQKHKHQGQSEGGPDAGMQKTDLLRLKHHARTQQLALRVKGFTGLPEQVLPLENAYRISAAFDWDSLDILTIEYKLPLALVLGHSLTATDTLKPISIGFIEPAPEVAHTNSGGVPEGDLGAGDVSRSGSGMNQNGMGGMNNGMGGGGMGRGMGGGNRGGGTHFLDTNPANQEQKVWSKVYLKWIATN